MHISLQYVCARLASTIDRTGLVIPDKLQEHVQIHVLLPQQAHGPFSSSWLIDAA